MYITFDLLFLFSLTNCSLTRTIHGNTRFCRMSSNTCSKINYTECGFCRGLRKVDKECEKCNSSGVFPIFVSRGEGGVCPNCNGYGWYYVSCSHCGGDEKGVVRNRKNEWWGEIKVRSFGHSNSAIHTLLKKKKKKRKPFRGYLHSYVRSTEMARRISYTAYGDGIRVGVLKRKVPP
jgi:hypothetical protein